MPTYVDRAIALLQADPATRVLVIVPDDEQRAALAAIEAELGPVNVVLDKRFFGVRLVRAQHADFSIKFIAPGGPVIGSRFDHAIIAPTAVVDETWFDMMVKGRLMRAGPVIDLRPPPA